MSDDPPHPTPAHADSADGSAAGPEGERPNDDQDPWQPPPDGAVIRLMGELLAHVPLWSDEDGLMFNDTAAVIDQLGVSPTLAADLEAWGIAWPKRSGEPDHDAAAARLVRRLTQELGHRYQFVYRP